MDGPADADTAVIIGGGAAGLGLALRLTARGGHRVTVVEPPDGPARPADRTWCYWSTADGDFDRDFDDVVTATWPLLRVHAADGGALTVDPAPLRYRMLRSGPFERWAHGRLADAPGARLLRATADTVRELPGGGAEIACTAADGGSLRLRARHVFDSRPPRAFPPARTRLLQHFRGWFVRTGTDRFDPGVAELMDFRVPQPEHGLAFGYLLPLAPDRALVEYTEFSRAPLTRAAYDDALHHYCRRVLGLGDFTVESAEQGAIPMTDARFPGRAGPSVLRIGTAGGATRPSTGYTFAAAQRHAAAVADALHASRRLPAPHGRRALAMDAVMLRALDTGRVDGPDFFSRLFRGVPTDRLLRFLDGTTTPREDVSIGLRTPVAPMLRTVLELPFLPRRTRPDPLPPPQTRHQDQDEDQDQDQDPILRQNQPPTRPETRPETGEPHR